MKKQLMASLCVLFCFLLSFVLSPQDVSAAPGKDSSVALAASSEKNLTEDAKDVIDATNKDILNQMHSATVRKFGIDMVMSVVDSIRDDTQEMFNEILAGFDRIQKSMDAQFDEMSEEIASAQLSQYMIELDKAMAMVTADINDLKAISDASLSEEQRSVKAQELRNSIYEHDYDEVLNLIDILIDGNGVSKSLLDVHEDYINAKYDFQNKAYYEERAALYDYLTNIRILVVLLQMNYDMSLDGPLNPLGQYYQNAMKRYNNLYDFINKLTVTMDMKELKDTTHMVVTTDAGGCRVMVSNRNEDMVYLVPYVTMKSATYFEDESSSTSSSGHATYYWKYKKNQYLDSAMENQDVSGVSFHLMNKAEAEAFSKGSQGNIATWMTEELGFNPGLNQEDTVVQLNKPYITKTDNSIPNVHREYDYSPEGGANFNGETMVVADINAENVCKGEKPKAMSFIYCGSASEFAKRNEEIPVPKLSATPTKTVSVTKWENLTNDFATLNSGDTLDMSQLNSNDFSVGTSIDFSTHKNVLNELTVIGNPIEKFKTNFIFSNRKFSSTGSYTLKDYNLLVASENYSFGIEFLEIKNPMTLTLQGDVTVSSEKNSVQNMGIAVPRKGLTINGSDAELLVQNLNEGFHVERNETPLIIKNANMTVKNCKYGIYGPFILDGGTYIFDGNNNDFFEDLKPQHFKNLPMIIANGYHEYSDCSKMKVLLTDEKGDKLSGKTLYLRNYKTNERQPFKVWSFDSNSNLASFDSTFSTFIAPGTYSIENEDNTLHTPYFLAEAGKIHDIKQQLTAEERPLPTEFVDDWVELSLLELKNGQTLDLSHIKDKKHYTYTIPDHITDLTVVGGAGNNVLDLTLAVSDSRTKALNLKIEKLYIQCSNGPAIDIAKNKSDNKLQFKGDNSLITKDSSAAAIRVADLTYTLENPTTPYLGQLTIAATENSAANELVAKCGNGKGAGIGGSRYELAGKINIKSGTIYASGHNGAGIGGGSYYGSGGDILISGGNIKAESTGNSAAIGGGSNSDSGKITISGGNISLADQRGMAAGIGYAQGYPKSILPSIVRPSTGTIDIQFANVRSFNNESSLAPIIYTKNFNSSSTTIKAVIMESATKRLNNYDVNIIDSSGAIKSTVTTWGADTANDRLSGGTIYTYLPAGSYSFQSATKPSLIGMNLTYPTGLIKSNGANLGEVDLILTKVNTEPMAFNDVVEGAWYHSSVSYVYQHNLMVGVKKDTFAPQSAITRAMAVAVLARLSKEDISSYQSTVFTDVKINSWYGKEVAWAYENDIIAGVGNKKFNPEGKITREEFVKMIYNYARNIGINTKQKADIKVFSDGEEVSSWAENSMQWATKVKLISGYDDKTLRPKNNLSRAEAATIFYIFIEKVMP